MTEPRRLGIVATVGLVALLIVGLAIAIGFGFLGTTSSPNVDPAALMAGRAGTWENLAGRPDKLKGRQEVGAPSVAFGRACCRRGPA